ncbi:MAG: rhodanese-like domain-containing protein [Epsilonproteobacteria bacterium]|nr:rhodanese-like domain-containing protein [Campylobacterota bacterium]
MFKYATPENNKEQKISLDEFIELFNQNKAILLDIRMPYEVQVWAIPFAKHIPANELEKRIDELDKDKLIVTACPTQNRSPFAAIYLQKQGFNAKFLEGGFLNLVDKLRGEKAKQLKMDNKSK